MITHGLELFIIDSVNNILHPAFRCSISDGTRVHCSVEQFCKYQTFVRLDQQEGVDALAAKMGLSQAISAYESILNQIVSAAGVSGRLDQEFRQGRLVHMRSAYEMRLEQDADFRQKLLSTGQRLIVYCDAADPLFGCTLSASELKRLLSTGRISANDLKARFRALNAVSAGYADFGENKVGQILMEIRDTFLGGESKPTQTYMPFNAADMYSIPSSYWENDPKTVDDFTVSERVVALTGIFLPLSCFYGCRMKVNERHYRSVAHYGLISLLRLRRGNARQEQEIFRTEDSQKLLSKVIQKSESHLTKAERVSLVRYLDTAVACKFEQHPSLKQLLLATGDALLVETLDNSADTLLACGMNETELMSVLCRPHVSACVMLKWMLHPSALPKKYAAKFGLNYGGLALMRYREYLRTSNRAPLPALERSNDPMAQVKTVTSFATADLPPLVAPFAVESIAPFRELISAFGIGSMFHPAYSAPIVCPDKKTVYPSVYHFVFMEGCRFLEFPYDSQVALAKVQAENVSATFQQLIRRRCPDVDLLNTWNSDVFFQRLKLGLRLRFIQHPKLMRSLLETGESVLVYCHRCSNCSPELAIGMSASDLESWMNICRLDAGKLLGFVVQPFGRRLAFLGGNRLGIILMQLRREFRLEGFTMEELPCDTSGLICFGDVHMSGLDEGMCVEHGPLPVWPNPFLLLSKLKHCWYDMSSPLLPIDYAELPRLGVGSDRDDRRVIVQIILDAAERLRNLESIRERLQSQSRAYFRELSNHAVHVITECKGITYHVPEKDGSQKTREPDLEQSGIPKLHLDPVINKQVILLEAGFVVGLKESADPNSVLLRLDWDSADMQLTAQRTWYHLTDVERSKALIWLKHSVESLRMKLDRRKLFDTRSFVSVANFGRSINWHYTDMNNLSAHLLETQQWRTSEAQQFGLNIQFARRLRSYN